MLAETPCDYAMGYGKPPCTPVFRGGSASNPKGRPRGRKNMSSFLSSALSPIIENGLVFGIKPGFASRTHRSAGIQAICGGPGAFGGDDPGGQTAC